RAGRGIPDVPRQGRRLREGDSPGVRMAGGQRGETRRPRPTTRIWCRTSTVVRFIAPYGCVAIVPCRGMNRMPVDISTSIAQLLSRASRLMARIGDARLREIG